MVSGNNVSVAFVFPGQGSQYVGMGRDLYENFKEAREIYNAADDVLGYALSEICFYGPEDAINETQNTQPAVLTTSIAALSTISLRPFMVSGHSLGEYSALVAAGALAFKDAVALVSLRARLMQEAVPAGKGLMAAVIGLDRETLKVVCNEAKGYVAPANYNCPGQIVIAGEHDAVKDAMAKAIERDAKKAIPLSVSVPSHCELMKTVGEGLRQAVKGIEIAEPVISIVNNADARIITKAGEIRDSLIRQLSQPLLWEDSIKRMIEEGVDTFVEVGPGKVLSGLIRRINSGIRVFNVEDTESLKRTMEALI